MSRDEDGQLRGIEVQRLKDKLGTRQMPTAELLLDGLPAHRVSYTRRVIGYNNLLINYRLCLLSVQILAIAYTIFATPP